MKMKEFPAASGARDGRGRPRAGDFDGPRDGAQETAALRASATPEKSDDRRVNWREEAARGCGRRPERGPETFGIGQTGSRSPALSVHQIVLAFGWFEFRDHRRGLYCGWREKICPGLFQNRTASIQKAMEEARKASADANRRLAEIESRSRKLDVEIGTMQANAEKEVRGGRATHRRRD